MFLSIYLKIFQINLINFILLKLWLNLLSLKHLKTKRPSIESYKNTFKFLLRGQNKNREGQVIAWVECLSNSSLKIGVFFDEGER